MPNYTVKITLNNSDVAEYGVANSAVNPRDIPGEYTTQEWTLVNRVLTHWLKEVIRSGIKKLEIERE